MHIAATICAAAGIRGDIEIRPRIFLSDEERIAGKVVSRSQIVIQTSSLGAGWPILNKQWPIERFSAVTNALKGDFDLVQLGVPSDPKLFGALDLRGKTTVRQAAAILSASHVFVGLEGGLMHMARAVDCRSVIIYGGRLLPSQTGYSANANLSWVGPCAPCWQRDACDFDRICLQEISSESVVTAAHRQAELYGKPLPVDRLTI
jgi:ADP-heptose:LPS heptosyltransferase